MTTKKGTALHHAGQQNHEGAGKGGQGKGKVRKGGEGAGGTDGETRRNPPQRTDACSQEERPHLRGDTLLHPWMNRVAFSVKISGS